MILKVFAEHHLMNGTSTMFKNTGKTDMGLKVEGSVIGASLMNRSGVTTACFELEFEFMSSERGFVKASAPSLRRCDLRVLRIREETFLTLIACSSL